MITGTVSNVRAVLRAYWYLRHADRVGTKVRVWGRPSIANRGKMCIGDRVRLDSRIATLELVTDAGATLEIETGTYINYGCSIGATRFVKIGPFCTIGTHVIIMDNNYHRLEPQRRQERPDSAPVTLGENVWLGARVIVLPGVTIGDCSVVGAGSVVTRDIPPHSLAVGLPAKVVRSI